MSTESSKVGFDRLPSTLESTLSTTRSSFESSTVVDDDSAGNSKIAIRHPMSEDYTVSSLGSADDSCFSGGTASESYGRLSSHNDLQRSPRPIKGCLSSQRGAPKAHVGRRHCPIVAPICHVKPLPASPAVVRVVGVVATPVSPYLPSVHSAGGSTTSCASCRRKDTKLKKQAAEIEQLKSLVNHLVGLLGSSIIQTKEDTVCAGADSTPVKWKDETRTKHPETKCTESVASTLKVRSEGIEEVPCVSDEEDADRSCLARGGDDSVVPSIPGTPLFKGVRSNSYPSPIRHDHEATRPLQNGPGGMAPVSPTGTMLRLCHLKNLKEEESRSPSTASSKSSSAGGTRHIHVCVRGEWGYYSGPTLEQNKKLHGCVVRFDNGDLYLGEMLLFVPKTATFTDEHGLQFHGRGTLYRKDGPTTRGLFHKHEMQE